MNTMFDTLLQLPLFQGLCHEDFTSILEKTKLQFTKHNDGATIVSQGQTCDQLLYLIKGELIIETTSKDNTFTFIERVEAPAVIEPHAMFGMKVKYNSSYIANGEVNTISISKSYILTELLRYEIFRLNYMNFISNKSQSANDKLWSNAPTCIEDKIKEFIINHIDKPQGVVCLKIKMEDLARYLDDTRLNVSKALNALQENNILELKRKEIIIPDASKLI